MLIFIAAAVVGLLVGMARGGSLRGLANVRFSAAPLVWVAIVAQALLGLRTTRGWPDTARTAIVFLSFGLVGLFLAKNLRRMARMLGTGVALLALGWVLNTFVVFANGGMPVSRHALAISGLPSKVNVEEGHLWKHRTATSRSRFRWLGDVVALPRLPAVFSVGDLSMMAGIAVVVAAASETERRQRRNRDQPAWAGDVRERRRLESQA